MQRGGGRTDPTDPGREKGLVKGAEVPKNRGRERERAREGLQDLRRALEGKGLRVEAGGGFGFEMRG